MIITIAGEGGAGKTTVAKMLAERLGYKHVSAGGVRREIAMRHGMTIDQLNEIGKTEFWTDKECDDYIVELGKKQDDLVIDSWMAWHFIPHSKKIYLKVDAHAAAERVFSDQRPSEAKQTTVEGVHKAMQERHHSNIHRYQKWYGADFTDESKFDFVLDTTYLTKEQVVQEILDYVKRS